MPTFMAFKDGAKVGEVIGAKPSDLTVCALSVSTSTLPELTYLCIPEPRSGKLGINQTNFRLPDLFSQKYCCMRSCIVLYYSVVVTALYMN